MRMKKMSDPPRLEQIKEYCKKELKQWNGAWAANICITILEIIEMTDKEWKEIIPGLKNTLKKTNS
jgi:hypothetical protein